MVTQVGCDRRTLHHSLRPCSLSFSFARCFPDATPSAPASYSALRRSWRWCGHRSRCCTSCLVCSVASGNKRSAAPGTTQKPAVPAHGPEVTHARLPLTPHPLCPCSSRTEWRRWGRPRVRHIRQGRGALLEGPNPLRLHLAAAVGPPRHDSPSVSSHVSSTPAHPSRRGHCGKAPSALRLARPVRPLPFHTRSAHRSAGSCAEGGRARARQQRLHRQQAAGQGGVRGGFHPCRR